MTIRYFLYIILMALLTPAYAYDYNGTPTGVANPPETMSDDSNIPLSPNIFPPATPLSKQPPPGTVAMPGETNNNNTNYRPVYTQ